MQAEKMEKATSWILIKANPLKIMSVFEEKLLYTCAFPHTDASRSLGHVLCESLEIKMVLHIDLEMLIHKATQLCKLF